LTALRNPSANIGVNDGNTGINDLTLGFEIAVLKVKLAIPLEILKFWF
jgi:hypothetical protein